MKVMPRKHEYFMNFSFEIDTKHSFLILPWKTITFMEDDLKIE